MTAPAAAPAPATGSQRSTGTARLPRIPALDNARFRGPVSDSSRLNSTRPSHDTPRPSSRHDRTSGELGKARGDVWLADMLTRRALVGRPDP